MDDPRHSDGYDGNDDGYDGVCALERPHDALNRIAAGHRAATLSKMLFSEHEVAIILGCGADMLKVWRRVGKGGPPYVLLGGKLVRYPRAELQRYVAELDLLKARGEAA